MFELQILKSPGESPKDYWFCSGSRCYNNSPIIPKSPEGCRAVLPKGGEDEEEGKAPKVATVEGNQLPGRDSSISWLQLLPLLLSPGQLQGCYLLWNFSVFCPE